MYKIIAIKRYGEYYEKRVYVVEDYQKWESEIGETYLILKIPDRQITLAAYQFDEIDIKREY